MSAFEDFAREEEIAAILSMGRIAVVGLSSDPWRASHDVSSYMQAQGYTIVPVNPHETEVLGERAYASLLDLPEPPEVVNIFRRPHFVGQIVEDAIAVGAKAVWMQLGVSNLAAAREARQAGLMVVVERCIKVEHARRRRRIGGWA